MQHRQFSLIKRTGKSGGLLREFQQDVRRMQAQHCPYLPCLQICSSHTVSNQQSRYLTLKIMTSQLMGTFIIVTLLLAADFWVTKNIAGVQLAALKWYTKQGDNNEEKWCFESSQTRVAATLNVGVFWISQFLCIFFWISIFMINLVTLSMFWSFLAIFCCVLLGSNLVFFLECKGDHQRKLNGLTSRIGVQFFQLNEQK